MGLVASSPAALTLVDNFNSYDNSGPTQIGSTPGNLTGDVWVGIPDGTSNARIYNDPAQDDGGASDNMLEVYGSSGNWRGAEANLATGFGTDHSIANGDTATTLFLQFQVKDPGANDMDSVWGLTEAGENLNDGSPWDGYAVMGVVGGPNNTDIDFRVRDENQGDLTVINNLAMDTWYNVWFVVNEAAETFEVYYSTGTDNGTQAFSGDGAWNFGRLTGTAGLAKLGFTELLSSGGGGHDAALRIDNIYMTSGVDVTFPLMGSGDPIASDTSYAPAVNPVYAGTMLTLSATASGTQPISYSWQSDNMTGGASWSNLPGSVANTYALDTTGLSAGSYQYRLIVQNSVGSYTNTPAGITVMNASGPLLTVDTAFSPSDVVEQGDTVTVSASFGGTLPMFYQWQRGGTNISGATNDSYTFSATFADAGNYSLVASNSLGVGSSTPAPLSVVPNKVGGALAGVTNETIYLMCYHEGYYPAGGSSGVFLSWSTNGYDFSPLNDGHPVFVPPEFPGDDADNSDTWGNLVRDPSIRYGPDDGLFHLVFTSDINSRSFGYAESPDLVHWSNVKLVQIWSNEVASIDHTWAPEIYYDDVFSNCYVIAFSSGVGGDTLHLQYTTTTDFSTWTDPQDLYRKPDNTTVIDGFIAKVTDDHYIMATAQNGTAWIVDAPTPYGPWTTRPTGAMVSPREGPALIKIGDTWHLYADEYYGYSDYVFRMAISTDTTNWTEVTGQTYLPGKADVPDYGYDGGPPHHCTVFAAPLSALGAFVEPYQDNVTNLSSLVYRWSFNESAGSASDSTIVTDTVSGAEAVVVGNRASFTGTGLLLPGDTDGTGDAAYLDLPGGIISSNTDLTVEIWATAVMSRNWQRLFSFGSGNTDDVMFWSLNQGDNINQQRLVMQLNGGSVSQSETCVDTTVGTRCHYVFTFEDGVGFFGASGGRMTFYRDGFQIGWRDVSFRLQSIQDFANWLGRSKWSSDSNSNVEYDEVRIYSGVLSWYDIYGQYLAGPDVLVNTSPSLDIAVEGAGSCRVSWPGNAIGLLHETEDLSAPLWTGVTNTVENSTKGLSVTLPRTNPSAFYRLER